MNSDGCLPSAVEAEEKIRRMHSGAAGPARHYTPVLAPECPRGQTLRKKMEEAEKRLIQEALKENTGISPGLQNLLELPSEFAISDEKVPSGNRRDALNKTIPNLAVRRAIA